MHKHLRFSLYLVIVGGIVAALVLASRLGLAFDRPQIESVSIFAAFVTGMIFYEKQRLGVAFAGVALLLSLGLLSIEELIARSNLDIILFLLGIFILVAFLQHNRYFEAIVDAVVKRNGPSALRLVVTLMIIGMVNSMLVGEVAAILVLGAAVLQLARRCQFNPGWLMMAVVFAINTGSAASPFGPIGVTVGIKGNLPTLSFAWRALPIAIGALVVVVLIARWWFAREIAELGTKLCLAGETGPAVRATRPLACTGLLLALVGMLLIHSALEKRMGLPPNVLLVAAALGAAAVSLLLSGERAGDLIQEDVDWSALSFFIMLFACVAAMETTGVSHTLASFLVSHTGSHVGVFVLAIGWGAGILSALLDNMAAVSSFLGVVQSVDHPVPQSVYWLLLFGGTLMGNLTVIGSTSNILARSMLERDGNETISFWQWMKVGSVVSVASMALATLLLAIQTSWLTQ